MKGYTVPIQLVAPDHRQRFFTAFQQGDEATIQQGLQAVNLALAYTTYVMLSAARGLRPASQHDWLQHIMAGGDPRSFVTLSQPDAFPDVDGRVVSIHYESSDQPVDLTWTQLFQIEDFRNTTEDKMEIWNVRNGITFRTYENGEKVELFGVEGDQADFRFQLHGAGFQWLRTWLDDNKWWKLPQGMAEAAVQYGIFQAETMYNVLATGASAQARASAGSTEVENDILTINAAKTQMMNNLRTNSGFVDPNPMFYLVYNNLVPELADTRISRIQNARYGSANSTLGVIALDDAIMPLGSPNAPTGSMMLVYPGRKNKVGLRQDLTAYDDFDIYTYSGARVFWARWVAAKADGDQVRSIPLS